MRLDFRWLKKLKATGQYELIQPYKKSYSSNDNSKVMTFRLSGTFGRIVRESLIKLYCILHVQYQFDKRYWYCKHEACGWKTFKRFYSPFTVAWLEATVTILGWESVRVRVTFEHRHENSCSACLESEWESKMLENVSYVRKH